MRKINPYIIFCLLLLIIILSYVFVSNKLFIKINNMDNESIEKSFEKIEKKRDEKGNDGAGKKFLIIL